MAGHDSDVTTAENYRRFARLEAAGRSPAYERLAEAVAGDEKMLEFLARLPPAKRQPNLLFAAARHLLGQPAGPDSLGHLVGGRGDELAAVMLQRRTHTNEPARCAVLLPALALLPAPLALYRGWAAAAGLTLLVDFYSYDYGGQKLTGLDPDAPVMSCRAIGAVPVPGAAPEVAWRAGLGLNPLDPSDPDDVEWLSCLLWPGEEGRAERLAAAAATARRHRVDVHRGGLLYDLDDLAALPTKQQGAVLCRYVAGLPYAAVGKLLNSSQAPVRRAAADGMRTLRLTVTRERS